MFIMFMHIVRAFFLDCWSQVIHSSGTFPSVYQASHLFPLDPFVRLVYLDWGTL